MRVIVFPPPLSPFGCKLKAGRAGDRSMTETRLIVETSL